ncbi:MAG: CRISPR-associated endonuclease Cas3'' [Xanthomonadaceae bacterium]|nr:CRISPR-associated endonuclease Cas3'' [Xanthomonadaceae bacterium]
MPPRLSAYFAHSGNNPDHSDWQSLPDHLNGTGRRSGNFAAVFGAKELGETGGRLHDLGKYTQPFLKRLHGGPAVDHASWGARIAVDRYGPLGRLLAYGIAGHHAGLANGKDHGERTCLHERLKAHLPELDPIWQHEIALPEKLAPPATFKPHSEERGSFQLAFLARMLFSTLVDADFLDTEAYYQRIENRPRHRDTPLPDLAALRQRLDAYLQKFTPDRVINRTRAEILHHVRGGAAAAPGLFSLTVPTGGGKTLASLAFALDHAIAHGLRRVIFVIPFTSIVEQNAAVFRQALGDLGDIAVLEHHSAFTVDPASDRDPDKYQAKEKLKLAMENWDAPVVVTTAVQFFESLFAARPSSCRKLHNIAGSVVILDEAQTLPIKMLKPCVAAIDELARNYRCSLVLCTATQPALSAPQLPGGLENMRELAPEPLETLFRQFERVRTRHIGTLDDEALAAHLRQREQVLCIVNNRRHARYLYQMIADLPGARHLTTWMCAQHRSEVLDDIRRQLKAGQPCRLISTSLIEAGVDVDFMTVLRAEAGLDSIAQAAGRCNREGRRPAEQSEMLVFRTDNPDWAPPPELEQFAQAAREILRQPALAAAPLSPEAIEAYFRRLYWQQDEALDKKNLLGLLKNSCLESLPLETLAAKFRMIENVQCPVIVPYDATAERLLDDLRYAEHGGAIARKLQRYLVQVPDKVFRALETAGAIQPIAAERWDRQFWALANPDIYDREIGLCWEKPEFVAAERMIW